MKKIKLSLIALVILSGFSISSFAQELTLPEVIVMARNYKYIRSIDNKEAAQPVKLLERRAASYDVTNSEYYEDDYDNYYITFFLPQGYVLAVYDQEGKLIRTAEKFKNVALPPAVRKSVTTRYPNWAITNDIYKVNYQDVVPAKMIYKLVLKNGNKRIRVKADDKGEILE